MAESGSDGLDRRAFIKRMAVGAFAIPVIASFQLDSLARAGTPKGGQTWPNGGGQTWPNQTYGNQTIPPNPYPELPIACYPNQMLPDGAGGATFPNQTVPGAPGAPPQLEHLLQQLRRVCRPRRKKRRLQ